MSRRLALFFLAALLIRGACVWKNSAGALELQGDALEYHSFARHLIAQRRYINDAGERATRAPGYPLFLAGIDAALGSGVGAVQTAQVLISAATVLLLIFCARRLAPEPWPWTAGLIALFYYDLFAGAPRVLTEILYIFLLSLFLFLWLRREGRSGIYCAGLGGVLGLACWVRPEALIFIPSLGLLMLGKLTKARCKTVLLFWLGASMVVGAWGLRNKRVLGAFIPTTTRGGAGAYLGLWVNRDLLGIEVPDLIQTAGRPEVEMDRLYKNKTRELYRRARVSGILKALMRNALVLVYPFRPAFDWTLTSLLPFWLCGLWVALRAAKSESAILPLMLFCAAGTYVFFGGTVARYRQPLSPMLVLLAMLGLRALAERFGRAALTRAAAGWVGLQLLLWALAPHLRELALGLKGRIFS